MKKWLLTLSTLCVSTLACANASIVGDWKTIDDKTHEPRSIVTIYEENGMYYGKIKKLLAEDAVKVVHCKGNTDEDKKFNGKETVGMVVLWDAKQSEETEGLYQHGHLFDPKTCNTYKGTIHLSEDGATLEVRGYVLMPMFGRSQTWERIVRKEKAK